MGYYPKCKINAKTGLAFDHEEIKTERKVSAFRFFITKNTRTPLTRLIHREACWRNSQRASVDLACRFWPS